MSSRKALRDFYKLQSQAPGGKTEQAERAEQQGQPASEQAAPEQAAPERTPSVDESEHQPQPQGQGLLEPEDEPLTALTELDQSDFDVAAFVRRLAAEQSLTSFVATAHQIGREQATLTSAQRELVNDNYKKLIQAAETLGYLSAQGDLAELDSLASSVQVIADVTRNIEPASRSDTTQLRGDLRAKLAALDASSQPPVNGA